MTLLTQASADIDTFYDTTFGFAETVTGPDGSLIGIFDNEYFPAEPDGTVIVPSAVPALRTRDADAQPQDAVFTIRGANYVVKEPQPDGYGETIHILERQIYTGYNVEWTGNEPDVETHNSLLNRLSPLVGAPATADEFLFYCNIDLDLPMTGIATKPFLQIPAWFAGVANLRAFNVQRAEVTTLSVNMYRSDGTLLVQVNCHETWLKGRKNLLVSGQRDNRIYVYLDETEQLGRTAGDTFDWQADQPMGLNTANEGQTIAIGGHIAGTEASPTYVSGIQGKMSAIWFAAGDSGVYKDLSVAANRRFFFNADGSRIDLGDTGVVDGITPLIYFGGSSKADGDDARFPDTTKGWNDGYNRGSGGAFALVGSPLLDVD